MSPISLGRAVLPAEGVECTWRHGQKAFFLKNMVQVDENKGEKIGMALAEIARLVAGDQIS